MCFDYTPVRGVPMCRSHMAEVAKPFNDDELLTDKISKKDIVTFLQENASSQVSRMYSKYISVFLTFKFWTRTAVLFFKFII